MNQRAMDIWIDTFEQQGWIEIHDFLSTEDAQGIRSEIARIQLTDGFKQAGIGKQDQQQVDTNQRGDFIRWINPQEALPHTTVFLEKIKTIIEELNYTFYLGIRDFECHYAHYPPGTFYKKHVDRHKTGSARRVSFVLYLNSEWQENDGGQLLIYDSENGSHTILPRMGTLALFLSEKEHEVLVTSRDRMSITGWMLNEVIL